MDSKVSLNGSFSKTKQLIKKFPALFPSKGLYCQLLKELLLIKAWRSDQVFYCNALAGQSEYNICINSDLTVSCNCQDFDGDGHIGDLNRQSLVQIFGGPTVAKFRRMLADRKLPTSFCPLCPELSLVAKERALLSLRNHRVPYKGVMVENTVSCNLHCKFCQREKLVELRHGKVNLTLEDMEKVALTLREQQIRSIYFFNLGEPFLPEDIREQVALIRRHNPDIWITTSTNGMLLDKERKLEAALLMDHIFISLDGVDQKSASAYQAGINFKQSYENIARLCKLKSQAGRTRDGVRFPIVAWKYVLFRWNDKPQQIDRARELAHDAGVDLISFYPGGAPLHQKSLRYSYSNYFKSLGPKTEDGIIINLNRIPAQFVSPSIDNRLAPSANA